VRGNGFRVGFSEAANGSARVEGVEGQVGFALPGETAAVRVQVAADAVFDKIVSEPRVEPDAELRIAGLNDATWQLRSRRIDAQGHEGFDANRSFVLKARPEPPACLQPRSDSKQTVGSMAFSWAPNIEASRERFQMTDDAAFTSLLQDRNAVTDAAWRIDLDLAKPPIVAPGHRARQCGRRALWRHLTGAGCGCCCPCP
jgi:hypothetical protein